MKKEMLINVLQPEECRIAIVENGVLEELYVERSSQESYVGNIYKGRIVNIEPSIQAAFVDFGIGRNGFLHVSDVDPAYYRHIPMREGGRRERRGGDRGRTDRGERGDRGDRPRRESRPERTWTGPAVPEAGPAEPQDRPFGAGIFDEDAPPLKVNEGSPTAEEDGGEDAPGKRKRRRGRRRRGDKAAEASTTGEAPGQTSEDETAQGEGEGPDDAPPRLETAERRTGEDE